MKNKRSSLSTHKKFMALALRLALKAEGHTTPNPIVGCVIVKNNKIISTGFHKKAGLPHAEAEALAKAKKKAAGADLYVTLEPCCHWGRTGPCTEKIIAAGIKRVFAAMKDPNPLVAGKGFKALKRAGIEVAAGIMEKEAREINRPFITNKTKNRPHVILKTGMSLDGKIARQKGRQWITSKKSRDDAQKLRKRCDAILVGINTILKDDPLLDCRIDGSKRIKKVILDTKGDLPSKANIFRNSKPGEVFVFTSLHGRARLAPLVKKGVNVIAAPGSGNISIPFALKELYKRGIMSVLAEGGSSIYASFIRARLVDEAYLYVAPVIVGKEGLSFIPNFDFTKRRKTIKIKDEVKLKIGRDTLYKGVTGNV